MHVALDNLFEILEVSEFQSEYSLIVMPKNVIPLLILFEYDYFQEWVLSQDCIAFVCGRRPYSYFYLRLDIICLLPARCLFCQVHR